MRLELIRDNISMDSKSSLSANSNIPYKKLKFRNAGYKISKNDILYYRC